MRGDGAPGRLMVLRGARLRGPPEGLPGEGGTLCVCVSPRVPVGNAPAPSASQSASTPPGWAGLVCGGTDVQRGRGRRHQQERRILSPKQLQKFETILLSSLETKRRCLLTHRQAFLVFEAKNWPH